MTEKKKSLYERQVIAMERQAEAMEKLAHLLDMCVVRNNGYANRVFGAIRQTK